ncbi:MAG: glycosyltransferase family 4 protein [Chloroflexota bacterium]
MHLLLAYLAVFGVALAASLAGTPAARALARRWGVLDQPSHRKVHRNPTPLLGGLAVYGAFWLALLLFSRLEIAAPDVFLPAATRELGAIFLASLTLLGMGFLDDKYKHTFGGVPPHAKLAGQLLAAAVTLLGGIQFHVFGNQLADAGLTVLWIIGISNAINFLDNMDGLSAGATSIAALFFALLAALNGQILVTLMALALAGACFGFLRYNFNPASVFMGDAGTLFMGFLLAVIGLKLNVSGPAWWSFILVAVVLALPIFDTSLVTAHRLLTGRRIAEGGKDHTSHRLVKLGLPHKWAVLVLYAASIAAGSLAVTMSQGGQALTLVLVLPALGVALTAGLFLARVET